MRTAPAFLLMGLTLCVPALGQVLVNRPTLNALNDETQSLYFQVAQSVVRVQLPTTRPSTATTNPADKTTRPAEPALFVPNSIGFVVDGDGHAMLPMYTDKANVGDRPIPALLCDGTIVKATFVGSDKPTNLTMIQVHRPGLQPLARRIAAPREGTLVMALGIEPGSPRMGIWTRFASNWGLVIQTDGSVAGFSGRGQFLVAGARDPILQALIAFGKVPRPYLGVVIDTVKPNDPQRLDPSLGQSPAIRIYGVIANKPAAKAGLQTGDLILSLAGATVGDRESFATAIAACHGPTELKILRQDQIISVTVDLQPPQN
jgi:S1-C subfamily serine protease